MDGNPTILLTNDDGIDEPGLHALYEELSSIGHVHVLAPAENQSAVGRSLTYGRTADDTEEIGLSEGQFSFPVPHTEHELGYAVEGTPCDCVIAGVHALDPAPDIVVSGCNPGANLCAPVFARSGTVSAAIEAAFLGVPSIAVSMDTLGYEPELDVDDFDGAARLTAALLEYTLENDVFDAAEYLNVNAPRPDRPIETVELTRPSTVYEMDGRLEDGRLYMRNRLWEQMANGELPDEPGTDRRAIYEGRASVSPLVTPHTPAEEAPLETFTRRFPLE